MAKILTQNEWLLKYLSTHKWITPKQAEDKYGIMRLASRISDLKAMGYEFEKETIKVKNRRGQICRIARYRLVA